MVATDAMGRALISSVPQAIPKMGDLIQLYVLAKNLPARVPRVMIVSYKYLFLGMLMKRLFSALILFSIIFLSAYFCRDGDAIRVAVLRKWMRLSRNIVTAMNGKIPLTWKGFCALEYREREQIALIMPAKSIQLTT